MNMYRSLPLIALLFVSTPLASAQISNGSFEDFTGFTDGVLSTDLGFIGVDNLGTASSWSFGQDAGIAAGGETTDGNAAAWLISSTPGGDAVVSQTFSIASTGIYFLRWDSFAEGGLFDPSAPGDQAAPFTGHNVDLSAVGGVSLFNADFFENAFDGLPTSHSVPFNATAGGLYNLTFTGIGFSQGTALLANDTFIDNVTVTLVQPVIPGDVNRDGAVNCDDVDSYRPHLDTSVTEATAALDLDNSGTIDLDDVENLITNLVVTQPNGVTGTFLGDLNCDGQVDILNDAFTLIENLNSSVDSYSQGDLNLDGNVDVLSDAFIFVNNLGQSNTTP